MVGSQPIFSEICSLMPQKIPKNNEANKTSFIPANSLIFFDLRSSKLMETKVTPVKTRVMARA